RRLVPQTKEDDVTKHFSKIVVGVSLIGAPLLTLVSTLVSPAIKSDEAAQIAVIAAHPARYYLFATFTFAGIALFVPAILGLMHLTRERAPGWGNWGGSLALVVGVVILSIGLYRSRAVPAWVAAGFVAGIVLNIVGFSASSVGILIVSSVILLAALATVGWRVLAEPDDDWGEARALALGRGRELASHPAG